MTGEIFEFLRPVRYVWKGRKKSFNDEAGDPSIVAELCNWQRIIKQNSFVLVHSWKTSHTPQI